MKSVLLAVSIFPAAVHAAGPFVVFASDAA